jgi:hypothetical protein
MIVPARLPRWLLKPLALALALVLLLVGPDPGSAQIQAHGDLGNGAAMVRSLESLRDLDHQSWQVVAYRQEADATKASMRLRLVGYPGKVRLQHPTSLQVRSGRRQWQLADVTLSQPQLAGDGRAAAAEFDLTPLMVELDQARPLRLTLPGVFLELPVPPYVVAEWLRLPDWGPGDLP